MFTHTPLGQMEDGVWPGLTWGDQGLVGLDPGMKTLHDKLTELRLEMEKLTSETGPQLVFVSINF